jgi:hypothetical protein
MNVHEHRDPRRRRTGTSAAAVLTLLFLLAPLGLIVPEGQAGGGANQTVLIKGVAYAFDDQAPIAGATIRARGAPGARSTSRADGHYRL